MFSYLTMAREKEFPSAGCLPKNWEPEIQSRSSIRVAAQLQKTPSLLPWSHEQEAGAGAEPRYCHKECPHLNWCLRKALVDELENAISMQDACSLSLLILIVSHHDYTDIYTNSLTAQSLELLVFDSVASGRITCAKTHLITFLAFSLVWRERNHLSNW